MNAFRVTHLQNSDPQVAAAIHEVMMAAYRIEAQLLGVADFAPLRRGPSHVSASASRFLGICVEGTLAAAAELEVPGPGRLHIASLVVRPSHFRRGLASALLQHIVGAHASDDITVETASSNGPALSLYAAHAFQEERRWSTGDGIAMVALRWRGSAAVDSLQ